MNISDLHEKQNVFLTTFRNSPRLFTRILTLHVPMDGAAKSYFNSSRKKISSLREKSPSELLKLTSNQKIIGILFCKIKDYL